MASATTFSAMAVTPRPISVSEAMCATSSEWKATASLTVIPSGDCAVARARTYVTFSTAFTSVPSEFTT